MHAQEVTHEVRVSIDTFELPFTSNIPDPHGLEFDRNSFRTRKLKMCEMVICREKCEKALITLSSAEERRYLPPG